MYRKATKLKKEDLVEATLESDKLGYSVVYQLAEIVIVEESGVWSV